jgi:NADP-dependent 3-hydroxy acid dehydrogenase YdfG
MGQRVAVVTGASSGIGAASARRLAKEGLQVVIGARRLDRLESVAREIDGRALPLDVTDAASVAAFCDAIPACDVLVNNAGGAIGLEPVEEASVEDWAAMYDANVLGTLRVTQALLPKLVASGAGHIVMMGSWAAHEWYAGGAGYCAAKTGVRAVTQVLRKELLGRPVRVTEIDPGMVETEFSVVRFRGDQARADAVYAGMTPLTADDVADCVAWAVTRPPHVNIDEIVLKPIAQVDSRAVHRVLTHPDHEEVP